jgi:membrane fusion protein (multidrug efflux system)
VAEQNSEQTKPTEERPENTGQHSRRRFIIIGLVAVLVVGALLFWWHSTFYEDTDDASVDGHLVQISARINGHVAKVDVDQNQYVEQGTLLVEIDPKDYETAEAQAAANLEAAVANYEATRVNVPVININTGSNLNSDRRTIGEAAAGGAGARDAGAGEFDQGEARPGPLHTAGAEGHHFEAAV